MPRKPFTNAQIASVLRQVENGAMVGKISFVIQKAYIQGHLNPLGR